MGLVRINYISVVDEERLIACGGIDALVRFADRRNPGLGVTGALVFTGTHFAEALEGSEDVVGDLMMRMRGDHRHRILVEFGRDIDARLFNFWALAYAGPSMYIARTVARVLANAPGDPLPAVGKLLDLMTEFNND